MEIEYLKSKENPIIKYAKSLHKTNFSEEENVFILEGIRIIEEAVRNNIKIKTALFTEKFHNDNINKNFFKRLLDKSEKKYFVNEKILRDISQVETNPGILVLAHKKLLLENPDKIKNKLSLYFDNIKDPGNTGTILRTSLAFGIKDIIFSSQSVSPYNTKLIRSSAGAVFKLNLYIDKNTHILKKLKNKGYNIYSTSSYAEKSVVGFETKYPCILVFGEEASGISDDIKKISDDILKLPLKEEVESLNVSVSAALFMYEIVRKDIKHEFCF